VLNPILRISFSFDFSSIIQSIIITSQVSLWEKTWHFWDETAGQVR
jgi:hypothetical protein